MPRVHVIYEAVVETGSDTDDIRRDIAAAVERHGLTSQLLWQYNIIEEGGA